MRNISTRIAIGALTLGTVLLAGVATASAATIKAPASQAPVTNVRQLPVSGHAHPDATVEGCPSGYVCLYPENAGWNGGKPESTYYVYGTYNLSNVLGNHYFFNNQTGNAEGAFCKGNNGTGTCYYQAAGTWSEDNFTPINSILLAPAGS
jgi:hypothetical protein